LIERICVGQAPLSLSGAGCQASRWSAGGDRCPDAASARLCHRPDCPCRGSPAFGVEIVGSAQFTATVTSETRLGYVLRAKLFRGLWVSAAVAPVAAEITAPSVWT
jgi:hypothetical protein